jgi:acetyltransferase
MPDDAIGLMAEYGIPTAACRVARSTDEAVAAAEAVGYPVAMKVRSTSIVHKTDVGGISLMLEGADAVRAAFERMQRKLAEAGLGAEADGVVIQPMALGGREVIVGMAEDPVFGPLVMLGLGGTEVEIHKDVAFALHPLTDLDPGRMVGELKARKALVEGWRGSPPVNMDALTDVLLRFSALVEDLPEIGQAEINPLLLYPTGKGPGGHDALIVDCRVMVGHAPMGKG